MYLRSSAREGRQSSLPLEIAVSREPHRMPRVTAMLPAPCFPRRAPSESISPINEFGPENSLFASVTAVGGTQGINPESASRFSSGGFSSIFPRPSYQAGAVDGYLKQVGSPIARSVNTAGRAYPDVSAQGAQYSVVVDGQVQSISTTSASSTTFAAVIALLNDRLLNAGKRPLGFLNPLLYSKGLPALNDIISGGSSTSNGESGFAAMSGWDPVCRHCSCGYYSVKRLMRCCR